MVSYHRFGMFLETHTAPTSLAATYNVSGWGTLAAGGSSPDVLNVVQVPPVMDTVCRQQYGTSQITARMMCAGKPGTGGNTIFPIP